MPGFLRRLKYWWRAGHIEAELAEELELHRQLRQSQLEASGMPPGEAAAASRRALGNLVLAREDARRVWIGPWLESVWQDAACAVRVLRRAPGFAASIVLVLSLGIGATMGVFSLLDALVLRSLPVQNPDRLVYFSRPAFSYPVFQEVRARGAEIFSGLFAWNIERLHVEWATDLEQTDVLTASGGFFSTLGVGAVAGRPFGPDDDRIGGGRAGLVAVISYGCWRRRFDSDPTAIGRTIRLGGRPFTIVGVTPPEFFGVAAGLAPELMIPLTTIKDEATLQAPFVSWVHLMGRLRDGRSLRQADAALQTLWTGVLEATVNPNMPAERRVMYLSRRTSLEPGRTGFSRVRNQFQEPLWTLLALVVLLLVVACASAANLLIARGVARRREIAVRLAIGASRARVVRQMLTEAVIWTILATGLGLFLARWGGTALVAMMTTREEFIVLDVAPGGRIMLFALGLALVVASLCAPVAAYRATRLDPGATLKGIGRIGGGLLRRWSVGRTLVAMQMALTLLLLAGAALFTRSLYRVVSENAGVERHRVLVMATDPVAAGYGAGHLHSFYEALLERLRAIPGVASASLSWYPPISNEEGAWTQSIALDGAPVAADLQRTVFFNAVSESYFGTVGMRLLQGRDFGGHDNTASTKVAIVNEQLARTYFQGANPLGRRITVGRNATRRDLEIVGVVSDAKYRRLQEATPPTVYLPTAQLAEATAGVNLFAEVRAAGALNSIADGMRREVRSLDARVPVHIETVTDRIRESLVRERVIAWLAAGLGLGALGLACAALYGLLAYAVSQETSEIGLRLALGADRRAMLWTVLRECLTLAGIGIAAGLGASLALGRYARALLYEVSTTDPVALTSASLLLVIVAGLAGLLPARRAANVDPVVALRAG